MPGTTTRKLFTAAVALCLSVAGLLAQADLSVEVRLAEQVVAADQLIYADIVLVNEGDATRRDSEVGLRLSNALFFVSVAAGAGFDDVELVWTVPAIAPGARDSVRVAVQPNYGGVHTLTAELLRADGPDWDSSPGNARAHEDDQDEACVSVPVAADCGQEVVFSAPRGRAGYQWFRDGEPLAYATADTLHPSVSGAYHFEITGEACRSGNCCPVVLERAGCEQDLALRIVAADRNDVTGYQNIVIDLINQGAGAVSRIDLYVTASRKMTLGTGNTDWQLAGTVLKTKWEGLLTPGDSTQVTFDVLAVAGGTPADYRMFAEISAFYAGADLLTDVDSDPDLIRDNDPLVNDATTLPRDRDEDDSDVVSLTECPLVSVRGLEAPLCVGATQQLHLDVTGGQVEIDWGNDPGLSCNDCPDPVLTVTGDAELTLTTRTADGCVERKTLRVTTEPCLERVVLETFAGAPGRATLDAPAGSDLAWCPDAQANGVTLAAQPGSASGQLEIVAETAGLWGGSYVTCAELCVQGACSQVEVQVVAHPRRDIVDAVPTVPFCLDAELQTEGTVVDVRLPAERNGVTVVAAGGGCFKVVTPPATFVDTELELIHVYAATGGVTLSDTTVVRVAGQVYCDLEVFGADTLAVELAAGAAAPVQLCVGALELDAAAELAFALDGDALATPTSPCGSEPRTRFEMRGLPRNWQDRGWRIERYYAAGRPVISRKSARTIADVVTELQRVHPDATVSFDRADLSIYIAGTPALTPGSLLLIYLPEFKRIAMQPTPAVAATGTRIALPAGTRVGTYALTATDAAGCADEVVVRVTEASTVPVVRDTFELRIEREEPLVVADLAGFAAPDASWSPLGAAAMRWDATRLGNYVHTFVRETPAERRERTYVVAVVERACAPLVADLALHREPEKCVGQTFALGLTRPGIRVDRVRGSVIHTDEVSGSRPGAAYALGALPHLGLAADYRVASWPGVAEAVGLTGNLQEIAAALRQGGADVRVDWEAGRLLAGGTGIGTLSLVEVATGAAKSLASAASTLPTYGAYYGEEGVNPLTASLGACQVAFTAEVECGGIIIVVDGGVFFLTTGGGGTEMRLSDLGVDAEGVDWEIVDAPAHVSARRSPDGGGVVLSAEEARDDAIVIRVCDRAGDRECRDVRMQLQVAADVCRFDIWGPEEIRVVADPATGTGTVAFPAAFDRESQVVTVDGRVKRGGFVRREVVVEAVYDLEAARRFRRFATPFGKTGHVDAEATAEALSQVLAKAGPRATSTGAELRVRDAGGDLRVWGEDAAGIWGPVEPRVVSEERLTLTLGPGEYEIEIAEAGGACADKVRVRVVEPALERLAADVEVAVGEQTEWCLPEARRGGTVVRVDNACVEASGEFATVELRGDGCYVIEGFEAGAERVCVERHYLDGATEVFELALEVKAATRLATVADRDTIEFGQFAVLEVLANDELSDEPRMVSLISEPYFGRAQVVGNSAIEYLHYGGDCAVDVFTYEVCQGDVCDSATVQLDVYCEELLVYNGFSPNGDGVNDELTILGLGQYPDHELSLFSREGNLLLTFREYGNDWRGDIGGRALPEGTYYYVIDLGDGSPSQSGYIQLSR